MSMEELDPAFILDIEQRPKLEATKPVDDDIPIIDLSVLSLGSGDTKKLVSDIENACKNWGFFQVVNHGVALELVGKVADVAKKFFELPAEEKRKVKRDELKSLGYLDAEHTKNVRDWKEAFDFLVEDPTLLPASGEPDNKDFRTLTNQWPQCPPKFREVCQEYVGEVEKLGYKLLALIAQSLGLPENSFSSYFFNGQTSVTRLNYYPPCPFPQLVLGVGRHKDCGALTVLLQDDVGGLQVRRKSDGEWINVQPISNAFIVNVGDAIQVWSNDKYESVEHRVVVNGTKERISIPVFFMPGHDVMVKPLDGLLNQENPPKYREYNWGKFFATRNRRELKNREVEYIQIHHLKEYEI